MTKAKTLSPIYHILLIINLFNLYVKFKPVLANLQCCTCSSLLSFSLPCRQCHNHFQNDLRLLQLCH